MKKLFLFVALFTWIGFSASAQVEKKETKKEERREGKMQMDQNKHHWVFKDGKVMEMKDGTSTEMTTETQVGDVWIRPNGEVVLKDSKVVHLKANEYLDDQGKIHTMMHKEKKAEKKMTPPKEEVQQ